MEDNAQVNDVNWDFYLDKMVSKTLVTDLTIRGSKTFTQTELSFPNGKGRVENGFFLSFAIFNLILTNWGKSLRQYKVAVTTVSALVEWLPN